MYGRAMIDHTGIRVTDLAKSIEFYTKALAPLGYTLLKHYPGGVGFGAQGKPDFWLDGQSGAPTDRIHIAFRASGRQIVRDFYAAAVAAGGTDNGAPGARTHYHEHYYGAFVRDPDGHNIEACCHEPFLG
jgi:catechol 2,3-dioxygenase-like lactoylglutathione lyase family enzyme